MTPQELVPLIAWLTPRLLLLFGLGFLIANIRLGVLLWAYRRRVRSALLVWKGEKPKYYSFSLALGVVLGILLFIEAFVLRRSPRSIFGEAMMFIYYGYMFPLSTRIRAGFYGDGVWSDSGFMNWSEISAVSWKEEPTRHARADFPREEHCPPAGGARASYGQARRVLRDRVQAHDIQMGGAGLDLGARDERDSSRDLFGRSNSAPIMSGHMAPRPTWKGYLKVSLVNIPVKVYPATESAAALSFNQLHAECQTRIQQKRWCPHCEREVANTELAKGYEFEKGRYVVVSEEDIEKVRVESTRVIDLAQFTEDDVDRSDLRRSRVLPCA